MIGTTINGKYRLLAELGHGAMGVVYRAEQLDVEGRVQRLVAVKTLKGELSVDPTFAQRFLQEIHVTMLLNHPHIVTVYDSGRDETGQLYFTMELVHGQTLRELLRAEGTVSVERMLHIAGHICEALAEAHSRPEPIVHRDLKPGNIFLAYRPEQDWVKVGDFGIAKVVGEHTGGLTHTGMSPGTPRYMAPEQCVGKAVDNRTDLYAVGVMMYEMLLGQPPFTADSEYALLRKHVEEPPPPLPATIPVGIRTQIERLLAKAPQDRPADALRVRQALANSSQPQGEPATIIHGRQEREAPQPALPIPSATTLVQGHPGGREAPALPPSLGQARTRKADGVSWRRRLTARWVATGVGLFVVTLNVLWHNSLPFLPIPSSPPQERRSLPLPDKPSIAVLPFVNISEDPKQEYFSDGMTDTLITDLSKLSGLFVIARNSTFA